MLWLRDDGPSADCELDIPGKRVEVLRNQIGVGILQTNLTRRDAQIKMVGIRRPRFAEFEISYTTLQAVSNGSRAVLHLCASRAIHIEHLQLSLFMIPS